MLAENTGAASAQITSAQSLTDAIMMQPLWLQGWVAWLGAINVLGAIVFIRRQEAKWVLLAMVATLCS